MAATAKAPKNFTATGKRKTAIARIRLIPGEGKITVNSNEVETYFGREVLRYIINQPFQVTGVEEKFDVDATITGGGLSSQADAMKYGIAKALLAVNIDYKKPLRKAGFLTRDSRIVERKKYGKRGARRGPQWTKR